MAILEYESRFPCSVEGLFDFLARPENIAGIANPDLGLTFTAAPDVVQEGSELDFQIVTFGQVVKARHKITKIDRPTLVIEQQLVGPMKSWTHRHEYEVTGGSTVKRDVVEFELPGGLIGLLLSESKVKDHLEDGFFHRERQLMQLIEQGKIT